MGAYLSRIPPPSEKTCNSFDDISGSIGDVGVTPSFSGFELTYYKMFTEQFNFAQTIVIRPRIYPLRLAAQVGEPAIPGSYVTAFSYQFKDVPMRLRFGKDTDPQFHISVPLGGNSTISMDTSLSVNPEIAMSGTFKSGSFAGDCLFSTEDWFSKGSIAALGAYTWQNGCSLGLSAATSIFEKHSTYRVASVIPAGPVNLGAILNFGSSFSASLAASKTVDSTTAGVRLDIQPAKLDQSLSFAFNRAFTMARVSASISTDGSIASTLHRKLGNSAEMTISSQANLVAKVYKFGLAMTIQ